MGHIFTLDNAALGSGDGGPMQLSPFKLILLGRLPWVMIEGSEDCRADSGRLHGVKDETLSLVSDLRNHAPLASLLLREE